MPETVAGSVVHRDELANVAIELLRALFPMKKAVRLLGVSVPGFTSEETDDPAAKSTATVNADGADGPRPIAKKPAAPGRMRRLRMKAPGVYTPRLR